MMHHAPGCFCRPGVLSAPCYLLSLAERPSAPASVWLQSASAALPPAEDSNHLQARLHEAVRLLGGWDRFTVRRSNKAQVASGFPDDLLLGHGRHVVIEYKREGQVVSLRQQQWLEAFWRNDPHLECYVGWPSDEARLVALLRDGAPTPRDRGWMTRLPHPCTCVEVV